MASIYDLLLNCLEELLQDDFDRFKSSLSNNIPKDSSQQTIQTIPRSKLENAKQLKVVELMVDQYGESDAANITVQILKRIRQNKLAGDLETKLKDLDGNVSGVSEVPAMAQGTKKCKGAEFVDEHRMKLIQRISSVMEIADCLLSKKMITSEMYSDVSAAATPQKQMRSLYRFLDSGGNAVKEEFYKILKEKHPHLVDDLEFGSSKA